MLIKDDHQSLFMTYVFAMAALHFFEFVVTLCVKLACMVSERGSAAGFAGVALSLRYAVQTVWPQTQPDVADAPFRSQSVFPGGERPRP